MSLAAVLEILAVCLQVLSLLGSFRLRERAAAAVVLARVRNSAGGGGLPPCSEPTASTTRPWRPLSAPCKAPVYSFTALIRTHSLSSRPGYPSLLPIHPLSTHNRFLASGTLTPPGSPSISCLAPNTTSFSYFPSHSPSQASPSSRLHPLSPAGVHPIPPPHPGAHQWPCPSWRPPPRVAGLTCPNRTPRCCLRGEPVSKEDQQATSRVLARAGRGGSVGGERV